MPRPKLILATLALAAPLALLGPADAGAQTTAAQILEKARGQAREIEELRKILTGPDQNMRLATFDAMVKSGDEALTLIAYEIGLASADSVMRAMAFRALIFSLDNLHLTLVPDPSAPKPVLDASTEHVAKNGNALLVPLAGKSPESGTFKQGHWQGQVSGNTLVFNFYGDRYTGRMSLNDDTALSGVVRLADGKTQFLASARLR